MKKLLLQIALVLAATVLLAGCEGPKGPKGDPGRDGEDGYTNFYQETITVNNNQWEEMDADGEYLESVWDVSALTSYIVNNGAVQIYWVNTDNSNNNVYDPLPFTRWYDYQGNRYEEVINYNYKYNSIERVGQITFFYSRSDFDIPPSGIDFKFRLVFMW